jgi:hypothetical protein
VAIDAKNRLPLFRILLARPPHRLKQQAVFRWVADFPNENSGLICGIIGRPGP